MTGQGGRPVRRTRPRPRPAPAPGSSLTRPAKRAAKSSDEAKAWVVITPDKTDPDDPEGEIRHARVGDEMVPRDMAPGDRVELHYLLGAVTKITK